MRRIAALFLLLVPLAGCAEAEADHPSNPTVTRIGAVVDDLGQQVADLGLRAAQIGAANG